MESKTNILSVKNLYKAYGPLEAVQDLSFDIPRNSCFGMLGPNGAGKTTTLEIIEGLLKPDSGKILFEGKALDRKRRARFGVQFQETSFQDFLTVQECLELFEKFYPKPVPLPSLTSLCGLEGFIKQDVRKISGGQRQRLSIALALLSDPDMIFLDEPTTGLDPQARRNVWDLINQIKRQNKTIVLTTHYMEEAYTLCDKIIIVDKGQVIMEGEPKHLLAQYYHDVQIHLPKKVEEQLPKSIPFQQRNGLIMIKTQDIQETLLQLIKAKIPLDDLTIHKPTLEDLFLDLTGHRLRE